MNRWEYLHWLWLMILDTPMAARIYRLEHDFGREKA